MIRLFLSNVWYRVRERWQRPTFVYVRDEHSTYGVYLERWRDR
jgi:hypothetical protein